METASWLNSRCALIVRPHPGSGRRRGHPDQFTGLHRSLVTHLADEPTGSHHRSADNNHPHLDRPVFPPDDMADLERPFTFSSSLPLAREPGHQVSPLPRGALLQSQADCTVPGPLSRQPAQVRVSRIINISDRRSIASAQVFRAGHGSAPDQHQGADGGQGGAENQDSERPAGGKEFAHGPAAEEPPPEAPHLCPGLLSGPRRNSNQASRRPRPRAGSVPTCALAHPRSQSARGPAL